MPGPALLVEVPDSTNITGEHLPNLPSWHIGRLPCDCTRCSLDTVFDMFFTLACAAAALEALQIPHGTVRLLFKTLNTKRCVQH